MKNRKELQKAAQQAPRVAEKVRSDMEGLPERVKTQEGARPSLGAGGAGRRGAAGRARGGEDVRLGGMGFLRKPEEAWGPCRRGSRGKVGCATEHQVAAALTTLREALNTEGARGPSGESRAQPGAGCGGRAVDGGDVAHEEGSAGDVDVELGNDEEGLCLGRHRDGIVELWSQKRKHKINAHFHPDRRHSWRKDLE